MRACYDIEDLTLDVMVELSKTGNSLSVLKNWVLSREINELQSSVDQVLAKASHFVTNPDRKNNVASVPLILPINYESFHRKRNKEEIVKALLGSTSIQGCATASIIIPIEGMFGLGKTWVAQAVRNDDRIQNHFDHKFWAPVSGDFNLGTVIRLMVIQAQKEEQFQEQVLTGIFQSLCERKRVFIVLDDVRNFTRHRDWEEFLFLLHSTSVLGVLITTRNPNITKRVISLRTIPVVPYHLQPMTDEDCLSLISSLSLKVRPNKPSKRKRCRHENALKMADKFCKGLPLVADIFSARLLYEPEDNWFRVLSRDLWEMPEFRDIFDAFRSDYSDLPQAVKNCFRYLSLFPYDFKFKEQDLVQLWMAESFIVPKVVGKPYDPSLEEIGHEYFDELLCRSILQVFRSFDQEEPQVYRMHELIQRYAQYVSSDIYLRVDKDFVDAHLSTNKVMPLSKARHISLLCHSITPLILKGFEECKSLRTLVCLHQGARIKPLSYKLFLNLQSLTVLSLSGTDISKLPESIGKLKHLQLLDVSGTDIEDLPATTTHLHRLKVLKLKDCPELLRLPKGTNNLTNLLHLELDVASLSSMPPNIGKLKNLQTLAVFIVGDEDGYLITELKNMKQFKGSICLKNLENVTTYAEAEEGMLTNKSLLRKLELEWNNSSTDESVAEEVIKGLKPHENLEELRVVGFDGAQFPSWLSSPEC